MRAYKDLRGLDIRPEKMRELYEATGKSEEEFYALFGGEMLKDGFAHMLLEYIGNLRCLIATEK
jgi:hypothetical protein